MRNVLCLLLFCTATFAADLFSYPTGRYAKHTVSSLSVALGDDTQLRRWDPRFTQVTIPSSFDSSEQKAYASLTKNTDPQPLVVSLHSWSADYRQIDPLANLCADAGWQYIHPDFRGPNNTPESCASPAALADIDDAIDYAIANASVDEHRIYIVGGSGGGHACCAISLSSKHRLRAAFAWVPITDIAAWYHQSKDRKARYASDIESVLGTSEDFYIAARARSPIAMPLPLRADKLHLFAGVRDGYEGSVPISHSLLFFNRLCRDLNESASLVPEDKLVALLTRDVREPVTTLGTRDVFFQRTSGFGSITIFDGAHEILHDVCFDLLLKDVEAADGSPPRE